MLNAEDVNRYVNILGNSQEKESGCSCGGNCRCGTEVNYEGENPETKTCGCGGECDCMN